ncbi:hypothetical protein TNCV_3987851 [Trichonephila clavipes]|nr:hypothetical protein TNCV_3987851 [Trichonephila clavipes]
MSFRNQSVLLLETRLIPDILTEESSVESDQVTGKTILRHHHTELFGQNDGSFAHVTSSVKHYLAKKFGNQIIAYGGVKGWPKRPK